MQFVGEVYMPRMGYSYDVQLKSYDEFIKNLEMNNQSYHEV